MSDPIHLDLRDLTDAHLAEALPHIAACRYSAPCIIGSLLTPEQRTLLDNVTPHNIDNVDSLVAKGFITFPEGQLELATSLQDFFDTDVDPEDFVAKFHRTVAKAKEITA